MRYAALRAVQPFAMLLAPVLLVQGRGVRARTPRLPEAAGPGHGRSVDGTGQVLRLAVLGESTAVGVGAERHAEALPGFLASELTAATGRPVEWRVAGRSGATARRIRRDFTPLLAGEPIDVVVVLAGINDLLRLRPLRAWERDVADLITSVRQIAGPVPILVAGMPHVHKFPSLPQPLRAVMGLRALAMDHAARRAVERYPQVAHLRATAPALDDPGFYATDRFHPSAKGYRLWAARLTPPLIRLL